MNPEPSVLLLLFCISGPIRVYFYWLCCGVWVIWVCRCLESQNFNAALAACVGTGASSIVVHVGVWGLAVHCFQNSGELQKLGVMVCSHECAWCGRWYRPQQMTILCIGDFGSNTVAKALIEKAWEFQAEIRSREHSACVVFTSTRFPSSTLLPFFFLGSLIKTE